MPHSGCHSTNPKIGDCSLTAASDDRNVFCYTTVISLPLYPSLTWLHWRRSMKQWRTCRIKLVMISISALFVLTWRCWTFGSDISVASLSTHVFSACGIVRTVLSITRIRTGFCGRNWCLTKKGTSSMTLWWRDRILFPPLHIKLSLIKFFSKALDKDGDCFTYLCQAFPGLTIEKLKAGIFDGTQLRQLIRDPDFENSMNEVELDAWKAFLLLEKVFFATIRPETMQNLSRTCWLLSEIWSTTWASRCTCYFHIWTGFLRTWVQWVTIKGRDSISTWKRWRPGIRVACMQSWWLTTVGIWRETWRKFKPWSMNIDEATCKLRVLTFINAHHSVYSNRCFYQVINICCWQNIFSLKNIFMMICVDKTSW